MTAPRGRCGGCNLVWAVTANDRSRMTRPAPILVLPLPADTALFLEVLNTAQRHWRRTNRTRKALTTDFVRQEASCYGEVLVIYDGPVPGMMPTELAAALLELISAEPDSEPAQGDLLQLADQDSPDDLEDRALAGWEQDLAPAEAVPDGAPEPVPVDG